MSSSSSSSSLMTILGGSISRTFYLFSSIRSRITPLYVSLISLFIGIVVIDVVPKWNYSPDDFFLTDIISDNSWRNWENFASWNTTTDGEITDDDEYDVLEIQQGTGRVLQVKKGRKTREREAREEKKKRRLEEKEKMRRKIEGYGTNATAMLISSNNGLITYADAQEEGGTDTYDIRVRLYTDANCFSQSGTRLYAPSQADIRTKLFSPSESEDASASAIICYANEFSNVSIAFDLAIVRYSSYRDPDTGSITPKAVNLRQYQNHCRSSGKIPPIQGKVSQCTAFMGGRYAMFNLMRRSQQCSGADCSTLKLVRQQFYSTTNCAGAPMAIYKYPIQKECLRYAKGVQTFEMQDTKYQNLTEKDYEGAFLCDGPTLTYNMRMDFCYTLYGNRGFKWVTDGDYLAANAWRSGVMGVMVMAITTYLFI